MKIEVKNVSKEYIKGTKVLDDVSFTISDGEKITLMGAEGAGKTTLFRLMSKLDKKFDGEIFYDDASVRKLSQRDLQMVLLSDELLLVDKETVLQSACFGLIARGVSKKKAIEIVEPLLVKFNLADKMYTKTNELGMFDKVKTAVCRGVARSPKIIIFDDIMRRCDTEIQTDGMNIIANLVDKTDSAVIYSVNTIPLGKALNKRTVVLNEGKVSFDGDFASSQYANVQEEEE